MKLQRGIRNASRHVDFRNPPFHNKIMKLEHYPVEKLKGEIIAIAGKYINLADYRIFFFGSRVRGNNFPRADIDIGIDGKNPLPAVVKLQIKDDLEALPTLYKFDLVDFADVSAEFKDSALKNMELIAA